MIKLVVVGAVWTAGYAVLCWLFPTMRCTRCDGSGRWYQSDKKRAWRKCRRCKGAGDRVRPGVKVINYLWKATKR